MATYIVPFTRTQEFRMTVEADNGFHAQEIAERLVELTFNYEEGPGTEDGPVMTDWLGSPNDKMTECLEYMTEFEFKDGAMPIELDKLSIQRAWMAAAEAEAA